MTAAPTDVETAQIKEKYDATNLEIERLKLRIQTLRKQKAYNRILRNEYDKHKLKEEKRKSADKSNNNNNGSDGTTSIVAEEHTESTQNELTKLHCHLSEYKKLSGHGNKVYAVDWNPLDNNQLVSVGRDGKLIFWNADTGYKRLAYPLDTEFIMTLKYSPNAQFVACGGLDDILSIFPVKMEHSGICNEIEPAVYKAHTGYISCLEFIDNNKILSSSGDATIRMWDINKNNCDPIYTLRIHREDVMSININPHNPNILLSGSVDSTAKIIDLREEKEDSITHSFYMGYDQDLSKKNRTTDVNVVKWFPDGNTFVTGCDDGTVRLFDLRSGQILHEYSYHRKEGLYRMDDGQSSNNSMVRTSTNTPIGDQYNGDTIGDNKQDDINHDKPIIASDEDPDYYLDEIDPTDGVATLDFSKSGAFMFVSYNNDKHKVLCWNMLSGDVVQELKHDGHVPSLVVSSDGKKLVTACWDHHLKLWS